MNYERLQRKYEKAEAALIAFAKKTDGKLKVVRKNRLGGPLAPKWYFRITESCKAIDTIVFTPKGANITVVDGGNTFEEMQLWPRFFAFKKKYEEV